MSRVLPDRRNAFRRKWLSALVVAALGGPPLSWAVLAGLGLSPTEEVPLTCRVTRADFEYEVSAQGEVESAVNEQVRCEVQSESSHWIRILEVVPEGKLVKPGDFLVRLDSSGLEADRDRQRIACEQATAALIDAQTRYESAKLAKQSYLEGDYQVARENARLAVLVAKDHERKARQFFESSRKLEAQGYITDLQLRADEYAWKAAKTELGMARIKLAALEDFTRPLKVTQLATGLITAKARLTAAECNHKLSLQRLAFIEEQIKKCVVRAPVSGQVVLAHLFHYGHSHLVEPGEMTLAKRPLVRLPDFRHMQVAAKIDEDKIALVQPGLRATARLEAFPDAVIQGRVEKINQYPEPEEWLGSSVKQYKAIIRVHQVPPGTRPGMTAELTIHVQHLAGRLQVPCPSVFRHGDHDFCITYDRGRWTAREVSLGPNNGTNCVVRDGLKEGEHVVLSAAAHKDKVELPPLPKPTLAANSLPANPQAARRPGLDY
jgi:multidrug efflux pump subunit AcrA (membrane-fusion protein)